MAEGYTMCTGPYVRHTPLVIQQPRSNLRPDQTRMRVDESRNSRSRLTANSHQLSCTLINFEPVQVLMRVNERFGSFDRS